MACTPPAQGKDPAFAAPGGTRHERRKRRAPARRLRRGSREASPARGSTAASRGWSSSEVFYPGKMFMSVLLSPCRSPAQKSLLLLEEDHSSPSSNTRSSGACFTVVLWELPSRLKSTPESPRRRRTSDGEMGRWSSTRLLGLLVPSASCSVPSAAPHPSAAGIWRGGTNGSGKARSRRPPGRPLLPDFM